LPKILKLTLHRKNKAEKKIDSGNNEDIEMSGEVNAAISMALYIYFSEVHDDDHAILTFKRRYKQYSPWSSKIYNVINFSR
jgi:glutaconyl-CoA/methylmalonyl-CoA decarboxylase subunit delta